MTSQNWPRVRAGLLTLPIGGLIGFVALLLRGPVPPLPSADPAAWTRGVTAALYAPAQYAYIVAYVLPYLGFWALYAYLQSEKVERLAFWGFMGAVAGTSLALPTLGVFAYVNPLLGELYAQGDPQVEQMLATVVTGAPVAINLLGGTLYLLGTVLLGAAVWRSGRLPRWTGALLALHGALLVFGFAVFWVLLVSWALLVAGGGWIAWSVWRQGSRVQP